MRSVRLDEALESRLEEAARITGEPVSRIIRDAVRKKCDEVLGDRLDVQFADVIGKVRGKKVGDLRHTGREFTKLLLQKRKKTKRKVAR